MCRAIGEEVQKVKKTGGTYPRTALYVCLHTQLHGSACTVGRTGVERNRNEPARHGTWPLPRQGRPAVRMRKGRTCPLNGPMKVDQGNVLDAGGGGSTELTGLSGTALSAMIAGLANRAKGK